ncbi:MAG TPA: general stress protein [Bacillaceae bacterium]
MKKNVVGIFASSYEAVRAIDSMLQDGIDRSHIYVVAKDDYETGVIEEKTGVDSEFGRTEEHESNSFLDGLKSFFSGKDNQSMGFPEHLRDMGVQEADIDRYANEVEGGKILVLVDSDYDMGRTGVLSTENIPERATVNVRPATPPPDIKQTIAMSSGRSVDELSDIDPDDRNLNTLKADLREHNNGSRDFGELNGGTGSDMDGSLGQDEVSGSFTDRPREYEEEMDPFEKRDLRGQLGPEPKNDYGNNLDGGRRDPKY